MRQIFYPVATVSDLPPGSSRSITVGDDDDCALFHTQNGEWYATGLLCPHQNESLDTGSLDGHEVVCRRHHLCFDVRTGDCTNAAGYALRTFPVRLDGDRVLVGRWED